MARGSGRHLAAGTDASQRPLSDCPVDFPGVPPRPLASPACAGEGTVLNEEEAHRLMHSAAEAGHPRAQAYLGPSPNPNPNPTWPPESAGVPRSVVLAARRVPESPGPLCCSLGDAAGQLLLRGGPRHNRNLHRNAEAAIRWLRAAAGARCRCAVHCRWRGHERPLGGSCYQALLR